MKLKLKIRLVPVLSIMFIFLFLNCEHSPVKDENSTDHVEFPDQEGWHSTLMITKEGQKSVVIKYGHMRKFDRKKTVFFRDTVKVDFYDDLGALKSKLTADSAMLNELNNDMEAIGNVVIIQGDTTLRTSRLKWISRTKKIQCDVPFVMITAQRDTVKGAGFERDLRTNYMKIKKAVVSHEKLDMNGTNQKLSQKPDNDSTGSALVKTDSLKAIKMDST